MIYIVSDIHGNRFWTKKVTDFIREHFHHDLLIINGDLNCPRGPILSEIKLYYDSAKSGVCSLDRFHMVLKDHFGKDVVCPDRLIVETANAETLIKILAERYPAVAALVEEEESNQLFDDSTDDIFKAITETNSTAILVHGDNEIAISDYKVKHIDSLDYGALPKYEAALSRLYRNKINFRNVSAIDFLDKNTVLVGVDALDHPEQAIESLGNRRPRNRISRIICHYPASLAEGQCNFSFELKLDRVDIKRMDGLMKILKSINLADNCELFYGHYHPTIGSLALDKSKDFVTSIMQIGKVNLKTIWVKPGVVFPIY